METTNKIKEIYDKSLEKFKNADFSTGFDDLDIFCKYLSGGDIMTIGGRPAMGKTNFAVSMANHLADIGKNVLFISLDNSEGQLAQRFVAEKIGIPLFSLMDGKVRKEEVDIVLKSYQDKNLNITGMTNWSTDDIEKCITELKPEIVFIDYVQLIEMPKAPNLTEATNLSIKELKRIAIVNNVIIVLLSQLSRSVESRCDKRPILSDLRNGSLLEEISDIILFIFREGYYDFESEKPLNQIIVAKNTMCPSGVVCLDYKNGFFRNIKTDNAF